MRSGATWSGPGKPSLNFVKGVNSRLGNRRGPMDPCRSAGEARDLATTVRQALDEVDVVALALFADQHQLVALSTSARRKQYEIALRTDRLRCRSLGLRGSADTSLSLRPRE